MGMMVASVTNASHMSIMAESSVLTKLFSINRLSNHQPRFCEVKKNRCHLIPSSSILSIEELVFIISLGFLPVDQQQGLNYWTLFK